MMDWTGERYIPWMGEGEIHYEHLHRYRFAKEFVRGKKVLDLACGEGYGSFMVSEEADSIIGVDLDEVSVRHASSKYIKENLRFIKGSITDIPIGGRKIFDVVVCFEALEHIEKHDELMKEVKRLLKTDGLFIVSTPNKYVYTDQPNYQNPFHLKELYFDEFKDLLSNNFQYVYLYGQKVYPSSNIFPLHKESGPSKDFLIEKGDKEFLFLPPEKKLARYFIAVASDSRFEKTELIGDSHLIDISETLFRQKDVQISHLEGVVKAKETEIGNLKERVSQKDGHIFSLEGVLNEKEAVLKHIYNSHGWKVLLQYYKFRDKLLPVGSRRRKMVKYIWNFFKEEKVSKTLKTEEKIEVHLSKHTKTESMEILSDKNRESTTKRLMDVRTDMQDFGAPHVRKLRIAFVGQAVYFRFMYEEDLGRYFDVKEFELKFGAYVEYYKGLVDFNPHVAFFFRPELYPDELLNILNGIKVALSSEPIPKHINGRLVSSNDMKLRFEFLEGAKTKNYDYFFHYDMSSLEFLREKGFKAEEFFFPVATGTYRPMDCAKKWDWGFIGRDTPHRDSFLGVAKRDFNGIHIAHGIYGEDFARLMNECKIGINLHVDKNISLEPRMQMMMACKVMTMSELLSPNNIFKPGVHYVEFTYPEEFWKKLAYYLEHDDEREEIALNGYRLVQERLAAIKVFPELINRIVDENRSTLAEIEPEEVHDAELSDTTEENVNLDLFQKLSPSGKYLKLDLGCGKFKKEGFTGVDVEKYDCVDVITDLNECLPFPDNSVREIFCSHALEHVKDPHHLLSEMHRVCIPDSTVEIIVPLHEPDPTHFTIFGENWFDNNLDRERFALMSSEVANKSGISPSVKVHEWTEHRVVLKVLKAAEKPAGRVVHPRPSIGFIIPRADISGGIMVVCQHANRLAKKGYDVVIISNTPDDPSRLDWFPGLLPEVIPINKLQKRIDIAVATHWSTAYTVRDFPSKRKIYFVQSDETRLNPSGSEEVELARRTYTFDFEFVTIARWLQKWLEDCFGKSAAYVPNGVDPSIFYPDEPLSPRGDKLRVLLEGPIDVPFKGMEDAFRVVDGMDCEVWCVSNYGRPRPGWKCDRFFEKVPHEMMRKIYSSCDVLVKMSKIEGFFMPPLEIMACGGTVITSKVTGYDEYVVAGYNGLVVEQSDVESAKEKLALLINDRELLGSLKRGAMETARNWSSWEYSNSRFEETIRKEAEQKFAGPPPQIGKGYVTKRKIRFVKISLLINRHYLKRTVFYLRNYGFGATLSKINEKARLLGIISRR